jgi:hypothetical protein
MLDETAALAVAVTEGAAGLDQAAAAHLLHGHAEG